MHLRHTQIISTYAYILNYINEMVPLQLPHLHIEVRRVERMRSELCGGETRGEGSSLEPRQDYGMGASLTIILGSKQKDLHFPNGE